MNIPTFNERSFDIAKITFRVDSSLVFSVSFTLRAYCSRNMFLKIAAKCKFLIN